MADSVDEGVASSTVSADAPDAWAPEDGDVISFKVLRKGKDFGYHKVTFDVSADGTMTATTDVELRAGLGPITVFKYELSSTETWKDSVLVGLEGMTNDDGKKKSVSASIEQGGLFVDGSAFEGIAPKGIIPSSHWNIREAYSSQILSTESGQILDVDVTRIGREQISVGRETIDTTHYRLVSDLTVDLWYDDSNRWVKLGFEARGQQIDYVLESLY